MNKENIFIALLCTAILGFFIVAHGLIVVAGIDKLIDFAWDWLEYFAGI